MTTLSEKRLAANRANAAKSTGPRTPQGKVRSSLNARKHGLLAQTVSVLRLEDQGELDNIRADAVACYQPRDAQEMFAVERIAVAQLMMIRGWRLEAGMFIKCLNMFLNDDESSMFRIHADLFPDREVQIEQNRNYAMSEGFNQVAKGSNIWSLILRYQAQTERQYRRAIEEFDRLRRRSEDFPNEPISDPEPEQIKEETPSANEPTEAPDLDPLEAADPGRTEEAVSAFPPLPPRRSLPVTGAEGTPDPPRDPV